MAITAANLSGQREGSTNAVCRSSKPLKRAIACTLFPPRPPARACPLKRRTCPDQVRVVYALHGGISNGAQRYRAAFSCVRRKLTDVSIDALQTQVGERDGQQLFVRENDGSVTAHLWSMSTSQWNLVRSCGLFSPELKRLTW